MPTLSDAYKSKGTIAPPLLHGSDLPAKQSTITVEVVQLRIPPDGFNSPLIMDIEPIKIGHTTYEAIALNKTNTKILMKILGDVDIDSVQGTAEFSKVLVTNPQTKDPTYGLVLTSFKKSKRKKRTESDDEVPF